MKTKAEILKTKPVFLNDWKSASEGMIFYNFLEYMYSTPESMRLKMAIDLHKGEHILFASYSYQSYNGYAFVLFKKSGKLYEVNASHCSCYGLENQWLPEVVNIKELANRLINGSFGDEWQGNFKNDLKTFLSIN